MTIFNKATILTCIITLITTHTFAQQDKVSKINNYFNEAHHAGLFNGNILIAENGKVIVKEAIGYADASKKNPLTTAYRFHIGSIAKEFDAVGIMMLQEQGKLNVDDKLSAFFPDLPAWAKKISIKNLLQYTSGLPDINWKTVRSDADILKDLYALQQLDFEPGSQYDYNNNNTFLRRRIIEKVSGMPFNQFVQQKILKPAGIKNGIIDPTVNDPLVAKSFNHDFKQDSLEPPISGWTCLNAEDFYKWGQCINNFCLINPASTREIITPFTPGNQTGLGNGSMAGNKLVTHVHDGSALNYKALLTTDATKGRTIIILSNQKQGNIYDLADAINAILDGKPYKPFAQTLTE